MPADKLERLREAAGASPATLRAVLGSSSLYADDEEHLAFAAVIPQGSVLPVFLAPTAFRREPARLLDFVANTNSALPVAARDPLLVDLAHSGSELLLTTPVEILHGYVSQAYRLYAVGHVQGQPTEMRLDDGPPTVLQALGNWLLPDKIDYVLLPPGPTTRIADGLALLGLSSLPIGDLIPTLRLTDRRVPNCVGRWS